MPHLLRSGCGALAWRRARGTIWANDDAFQPLHSAARTYAVRAALASRELAELVHRMRAAEVEQLVFKGWAAARLYAEPVLRPFGDLDLCVRPRQREIAFALVAAGAAAHRPAVDLHTAFPDLSDRSLDDVFARSRLIPLGGVEIRVLSPEDHLQCLASHFFRHGGSRPLSLCDIGAAIESMPADFDWEYCLGGDVRLTDRLVHAAALASTLLDARLPTSWPTRLGRRVPRWLTRAVLRRWASVSYDLYENRPLIDCLRRRGERMAALRRRWPNAVQLVVDRGARIGAFPPLLLQLEITFRSALAFGRRTLTKVTG